MVCKRPFLHFLAVLAMALWSAGLLSCADDEVIPGSGDGTQLGDGKSGDGGGGGGDGVKKDGAKTGDGVKTDGWSPTNQPACSGTVYACSDGTDNDGDKLIDAQDPECVGPCDNDESSYETGIPGDNTDACKQDCFFDGNSGQGDDQCIWNHKCDPLSPGAKLVKPCPYDSSYNKCPTSQSTQCLNFCLPMTPNGCDCFGCCQIFTKSGTYIVFLGSGPTCSASAPANCAPCTQVKDCLNTCGECELCLGKTIKDLPAKCFPKPPDGGIKDDAGNPVYPDLGPPKPSCPPGVTSCLTNNDCQTGYYCVTGCCIKPPA